MDLDFNPHVTAQEREYWRFTAASARLELERAFGAGGVEVSAYGNVVSAASFLYGLAAEELDPAVLAEADPRFEVILGIRATRPSTAPRPSPTAG